MKKTTVKRLGILLLKWLGILVLAHLVCMLLYNMILSNTTYDLAYDFPDDLSTPNMLTWIFGAAFAVVLTLVLQRFDPLSSVCRTEIQKSMREGSFSVLSYWRTRYGGEFAAAMGLFVLMQLPFVSFFSSYGFSFMETTPLEYFFVMDAGAYLVTGSAVMGLLLNTLWLGLWLLVVRLFPILLKSRSSESTTGG